MSQPEKGLWAEQKARPFIAAPRIAGEWIS
jgi:hypothetical protein